MNSYSLSLLNGCGAWIPTVLILGVGACLTVASAADPAHSEGESQAFAHEGGAFAADPSVRWGRLDNGMRYVLMPNQQPKNKVSLRLQVQSGSLLESDTQRGLAHYLEHMAFNGSTHFPPGTLISVLQGMGLSFGADTNAHTSFDETVYKLDLPDAQNVTIDTALNVLADYASGMLIAPTEVEHERGVILAEMRDRNSPGFRQWQEIAKAMYAGLHIAERMPIGTEASVRAAMPESLKAYYDSWYQPRRIVLTVVGAIAVDAVADQVQRAFSGMGSTPDARAAHASQAKPPPSGALIADELAIHYHHEAEADGTSITLAHIKQRPRPMDSAASRRADAMRSLAAAIINQRLSKWIAAHPQGALAEATLDSYQWLDCFHVIVEAKTRPGKTLGGDSGD